jgi:molybdopterin converting factor subunit 1
MIRIDVQYYALLREQARTSRERLDTDAPTAAKLYDELQRRHGFTLGRSQLRIAVDGEFADWDTPLRDGMTVVFIPPVAGG